MRPGSESATVPPFGASLLGHLLAGGVNEVGSTSAFGPDLVVQRNQFARLDRGLALRGLAGHPRAETPSGLRFSNGGTSGRRARGTGARSGRWGVPLWDGGRALRAARGRGRATVALPPVPEEAARRP